MKKYIFMVYITLILAGFAGTLVMTLFSHTLELLTSFKFNEAQLINILMYRSTKFPEINENHYFGWIIHFLIGVLMVIGVWIYYNQISPIPYSDYGICLGLGLGTIGISGWTLILTFHSNPPKIRWAYFFGQLILAHVLFSFTVTTILTNFLSYSK